MQDYDFDNQFNFQAAQRPSFKNSNTMTHYKAVDKDTSTRQQVMEFECQTEFSSVEVTYADCNEDRLSEFLNKAYPLVQSALEEDLKCDFSGVASVMHRETEELMVLNANQPNMEISDIQWNNLTLMVSYSHMDHEGSCNHSNKILGWNLNSRTFDTSKPQISLEVGSCVICLRFNDNGSYLAAGTFNGEVYLYDMNNLKLLAQSTIDEYFHRESITGMLFSDDDTLLTMGCEGKILLWPIVQDDTLLKYPLKGCFMVRKKESQVESVGGTAICQTDDPSSFIIGSEGGSLLKAQVTAINYGMTKKNFSDGKISWKEEAMLFVNNLNQKFVPEIKLQVENYAKERKITQITIDKIVNSKPDMRKMYVNPLSFAYEAHYGTIFSIHKNPFTNAFITASMDGQVRIYIPSNARSLAVYEFLDYQLCAQWSPVRPCVFAASDSAGNIKIFDLLTDQQQQMTTLTNMSAVTALRFNKRQGDLLAAALVGGKVKIYQLSDNLSQMQKQEITHLNQLLM